MRFLIPLAVLAGCTGSTDPGQPNNPTPPVPETLTVVGADGVTQVAFEDRGPRVDELSDAWTIGFEHIGFGRADAMKPMAEVEPTTDGDRVVYGHEGIQSWYVNRVDGMEQGFDLAESPAGQGPLRIDLGLQSDLIPILRHDRKAVNLIGIDGMIEVEYDSLFAYDSTGAEIDSWMELACTDSCVLTLVVDDADAVYPLTVDPRVYANVQVVDKPFSGNPSSEQFGYAVAVSGTTAVVGDPGYSANPNTDMGAAHVYTYNSGTGMWDKQADLLGGLAQSDRFGTSVGINGSTIVVGAPGAQTVTVYTGSGATWTQQALLAPPSALDAFGTSVALSGDRLAVGAPNATSAQGRVVTYTRAGTIWSSGSTLPLPGGSLNGNDLFGTSVSMDGTTLAVGAPGVDTAATNGGAVAVYTNSGSWAFQTYLFASDAVNNIGLGTSVAVLGDTLVSGAPRTGNVNTGDAYVFTGSGASWSQQAKLSPTNATSPAGSRFGSSVALRLNQIVVGAYRHNPSFRGAAYTYYRSGTTWTQGSILATGTPNSQNEGYSVGISTTDVFTGAPNGSSKGKVYIYRVQSDNDGDGWTACGGLVTSPCDCDDTNAAVNPDQTEIEGNTVDEDCDGLLAICGTAPKTGCDTDLVLTEILSDPVSGLAAERWIEIRNLSAHRVDLRNMLLEAERGSGAATNAATFTDNLVVAAGSYAVLAGSTSSGSNGGITGAGALPAGFTLYSDVDLLTIRRASSLGILDEINIDDEYSTGTSRPVGASIAMDPDFDLSLDNHNPFRWCDARTAYGTGQFGTPGAVNDDCDYSVCFTAEYTYPDTSTFQVNGGLPIEVAFVYDPDGTAGNVGIGVPPFDLARWFFTSNGGEGMFTRTTTAGTGQELEFTYLFVDNMGAPAGNGAIYQATQAFGTSAITGGTIIPPVGYPFVSGSWTVVPCP
ncbi:MAG: hypothetical protein H6737_31950 [Alphaproteobacteria bacterium]|nr:hypothetical protein [Alphaproteobacteria bacterium]